MAKIFTEQELTVRFDDVSGSVSSKLKHLGADVYQIKSNLYKASQSRYNQPMPANEIKFGLSERMGYRLGEAHYKYNHKQFPIKTVSSEEHTKYYDKQYINTHLDDYDIEVDHWQHTTNYYYGNIITRPIEVEL